MEHYDGDIQEQFEAWWFNEGSSEYFANQINYDNEERTKKICEQSWLIGAETAMQNLLASEQTKLHNKFGIQYLNDGKEPL